MRPLLITLMTLLPLWIFGQTVTLDTTFTGLFRQNCCGWTGSDGTISIALDDGRSLWGMGDSFIGEVYPDTTRPCLPESRLVNNTLLLQDGHTLTTFFNASDTSAYIPGTDTTVAWPGHGIQQEDTIYHFFKEYQGAGLTLVRVNLVKLDASSIAILDTQ
ncbi:MAG: hypothetical protein KDC54_19775, partial [Lewinella sp.]|nr:hypothetical protein [Lewinella sp.]